MFPKWSNIAQNGPIVNGTKMTAANALSTVGALLQCLNAGIDRFARDFELFYSKS